MTKPILPSPPNDRVVLDGVKATPFGWPAASLDTATRQRQLSGRVRQNQVSTVPGDCQTTNHHAAAEQLRRVTTGTNLR